MSVRHYLDYNATAPTREGVRAAMADALVLPGNPSSVHAEGRAARALVEEARRDVAALVGADPGQVIFTGSGSEANNLALAGPRPACVIVSAIEHASVLRPAAELAAGFTLLPVDGNGVVDLAALARALAAPASGAGPVLVSVMLANNETGVVQPVEEIVRLAREAGALVHVDAVQGAGRIAIDFRALGADMMSLSAHKLGGPKGVGALVARDGLALAPLISGGGQERSRRAGTENVAGIAGFAAAARAAREELAGGEPARQRRLRDRVEAAVKAGRNDAIILGAAAARLGNTSCIVTPGAKSETLVMAFDLAGIAVSAGSACSSGKVEVSHVMTAMGLARELAGAALRVSFGFGSTEADADAFIEAWQRICGAGGAARRSA